MASSYTMVAYGSQGSAVKTLQNELNKRGYQLDEDGVFGEKTKAAVRDYQKKNGLTMVDGIAGDETWGSLMSTPAAVGISVTTAQEEAAPQARVTAGTARRLAELEKGYQPSDEVAAAQAYRDSVAALQPEGYTSEFEAQLRALYDEITGRESFSYDPEEDEMYQRYAKLYAAQGAAAMKDTMGQAAALTGGYGSSYAQTAGQQAYGRYLSELAALVPELREAALAEYRQEGQALTDRYGLLRAQEQEAYDRWQDGTASWRKELAQAQSDYESAAAQDEKAYQTLLNYYADKAEQERKLSASGAALAETEDDTQSGRESLSSTAAESLQRAMANYIKKGDANAAKALMQKYEGRMTPMQRKRFETLLSGYGVG